MELIFECNGEIELLKKASKRGKLHYKKKKTKEETVGWNGDTEIYL